MILQENPNWEISDDLYTVLGTYSPLQFVVRLSSDTRRAIDQLGSGIFVDSDKNRDAILAFSTYLHETIHWWQHIGSTNGLMQSFAYPAQCHINVPHLRQALSDFGPRKSLLTLLSNDYNSLPSEPRNNLNRIVNNWHDVEFNKRLILDPLKAESVIRSPFFESVGHSLEIGLAHTLGLLIATFDRNAEFLPDPRQWEQPFDDLRKRRVQNFYYGGDVHLVPLGALRIFEGQARFCQLQYLALGLRDKPDCAAFKQMGMFNGVYVQAFEKFLEWTETSWPATVIDPIVHLFLLVCDLSVNSSEGYPFQLKHFESFVLSNDPSWRFFTMCRFIARHSHLKGVIKQCSKDEYIEVANMLCKHMICATPVEIGQQINEWALNEASIKSLLREDETFDFLNVNLPVRVCFARHIRFMIDKAVAPEFFCWPAMYFVGNPRQDVDFGRSMKLWAEHQALFAADLNGEILPTLLPNRSQPKIQQTFNGFYHWNLLYDFVRQWTISDQPFNYSYTWLTPNYTAAITKPFVDGIFSEIFGISPDDFKLMA